MNGKAVIAMLVAFAVPAAALVLRGDSAVDPARDWEGIMRIAYSWEGGDFVLTVTEASPREPLDCRWGVWARLRGADIAKINLTVGRSDSPTCRESSELLSFEDRDQDGRLSAGDRWVLRGLMSGEEDTTALLVLRWSVPVGTWGGNGWLLAEEPTIRVAWQRSGPDVHVTVVDESAERPLDSRWSATAGIAGDDVTSWPSINMTSEVLPHNDLTVRRQDPWMAFEDSDYDGWLSVGDRWVIRKVPAGAEVNLELGLSYWGVRYYRFHWDSGPNEGDPHI